MLRPAIFTALTATTLLVGCAAEPGEEGASATDDAALTAGAQQACDAKKPAMSRYWGARQYQNGAIAGSYEACIAEKFRVACDASGKAMPRTTAICGACADAKAPEGGAAPKVSCSAQPAVGPVTCRLKAGAEGRAVEGRQHYTAEDGLYLNDVDFQLEFETPGTATLEFDHVFPDGSPIPTQRSPGIALGAEGTRGFRVPFSYTEAKWGQQYGLNTGRARVICANGTLSIDYRFTRTKCAPTDAKTGERPSESCTP